MNTGERMKKRRKELGISADMVAEKLGVSRSTVFRYEKGDIDKVPADVIKPLAKVLQTTEAYLMGWEESRPAEAPPDFSDADIVYFPVIGSVAAGYDSLVVEDYTDEVVPIPKAFLSGHKPEDFFTLRVKGDSMYPKFLEGDIVLVLRCTSVDSGSIAVMLYNGDEATIKKVKYKYGEDWLELIPVNPEYKVKRIENEELEQCRVLGKVVKLIRDV